jgi:RNA polymerase sigma-70 factor, ECF subfamily
LTTSGVRSHLAMVVDAERNVTTLLREWRAGDRAAFNQLMPLVYDGLHRLASRYLRGERAGHTFRPTDLVSELYLKMVGSAQPEWNDRIHFFAIASRGMRQILVDYAHKRCADKRGGGDQPLTFDEGLVGTDRPHELIALDGALEELVKFDERKARTVELHYFGGLNQDAVAAVLGVHVNTVARDLRLAEAWIHRHLRPES